MPNPPRNQIPQMLSLHDFSAGIVQRTGVLGALANSPAQLGAASITNTYKCINLPGGGLGPLPKRGTGLGITDLSTADIPGGVTAYIAGILLYGPMYHPGSAITPIFPPINASATPFEVHLMYEYSSGGTQYQFWRKYPYYSGANSIAIVSPTQTATNLYGPAYLSLGRMNHNTPLNAGYPVIAGSWQTPNSPTVANTDYCELYPDPTSAVTAATDTPYSLGGSYFGPGLFHQGRYVSLTRASWQHGANNGISPINESIYYTTPNDYVADGINVAFGQEQPSGYGAWGSLTASDLLLIKHYGGAYLIQGDLNNPIVRRMPSVVGTGGLEVNGASTMYGFAYGSKGDGVYAWQGADSSALLSPQLEDGFWQVPQSGNYLNGGGFLGWGDWLLCPNNFLFNGQGWWRLDDAGTNQYMYYTKDPLNNTVYAAKAAITAGQKYAYDFSSSTPSSDFSWQSQPIGVLDRRKVLFSDIYLVAQGSGTVAITITPTDGFGSITNQPNTATISTSGPTRIRLKMLGWAAEFTVRIVSTATSTGPAPVVYQLDIPINEASQEIPQ